MSKKILTESFEIKSDLFIKKHFPDVILNDDDAQAASFHCKNHVFNDKTLYEAYVEYNLVIEKEGK